MSHATSLNARTQPLVDGYFCYDFAKMDGAHQEVVATAIRTWSKADTCWGEFCRFFAIVGEIFKKIFCCETAWEKARNVIKHNFMSIDSNLAYTLINGAVSHLPPSPVLGMMHGAAAAITRAERDHTSSHINFLLDRQCDFTLNLFLRAREELQQATTLGEIAAISPRIHQELADSHTAWFPSAHGIMGLHGAFGRQITSIVEFAQRFFTPPA